MLSKCYIGFINTRFHHVFSFTVINFKIEVRYIKQVLVFGYVMNVLILCFLCEHIYYPDTRDIRVKPFEVVCSVL